MSIEAFTKRWQHYLQQNKRESWNHVVSLLGFALGFDLNTPLKPAVT
jgi:hypothetical protein